MPRARPESAAEASAGVLHGRHPVLEALRARRRPLYQLAVRAGARGDEIQQSTDESLDAAIDPRVGIEKDGGLRAALGNVLVLELLGTLIRQYVPRGLHKRRRRQQPFRMSFRSWGS